MKFNVVIDRKLIATSEQLGSTKCVQFIIRSHPVDITNLKGFISGLAITDPEHGIAQITLVFAMIIFDGARNACHPGCGFIFGRFKEAHFATF
jgi:hypothetical protein